MTNKRPFVVMVTDFGVGGPYVGQVKAVLLRDAPHVTIIDLLHEAPAFDPQATAYFLPSLIEALPREIVVLCVVDPGVGGDRAAIILRADDRYFVGPDNGLFALIARRAKSVTAWNIDWRPERLSSTFHGRDLFAPVAAVLAKGQFPSAFPTDPRAITGNTWPDRWWHVVFIDVYGNCVIGVPARDVERERLLKVGDAYLRFASRFSEVPANAAFWYENANGLLEIAVNRGHAANQLGLVIGSLVEFEE